MNEAARRSVELDDRQPHSHVAMGDACFTMGRMKEAIRAYERFILVSPSRYC